MPRTGLSREEIIEKAAALANEKGLSYLTVTTLSDCLGIRKPSLYNHIRTIDDVYDKLMVYGWKKVSDEIVAGIDSDDPRENLKEYGRAFYSFAMENPGVFEAMLWYNKYSDASLLEATEGLYTFFFAQTDALQVDRETAGHLLRTYRAFLEGFIMLQLHHSFGYPTSVEESFEISLDVLLSGMEQLRRNGMIPAPNAVTMTAVTARGTPADTVITYNKQQTAAAPSLR